MGRDSSKIQTELNSAYRTMIARVKEHAEMGRLLLESRMRLRAIEPMNDDEDFGDCGPAVQHQLDDQMNKELSVFLDLSEACDAACALVGDVMLDVHALEAELNQAEEDESDADLDRMLQEATEKEGRVEAVDDEKVQS